MRVDELLAFGAALLSLRLAGSLLRRRRWAWGAGLVAYAVASAALAWSSAAGWDEWSFRVYYLFGGLLTAPLLGVGSLELQGRRWARPAGLLYAGLAAGIALAAPVHGTFGDGLPPAQDHLGWLPRVVAIGGNSLGTLAIAGVALATIRRRPLGNGLVLAGVVVAALGSGLAGTGVAATAAFVAAAAVLLYFGFVMRPAGARRTSGIAGG